MTVFERDEKIGGLLRYGIPDFKLEKSVLDRRLDQLRAEGVQFQTGVVVGEDISARYLQKMFDATCITMGASVARDLEVPGRGFENVHFAMDYLKQQNCINASEEISPEKFISAKGKVVVVIGGGDTGSDCVGTARRQGAKEIHMFEILPKPPDSRPFDTPWPQWPRILRTSSSHQEGCHRRWCVLTKKLSGVEVRLTELHGVEVEWKEGHDGWRFAEVPGSEFSMKVDLVLLAMGFVHVAHTGLLEQFGLELDQRGNIKINDYACSVSGVFAAGDAEQGASLVVRAIYAGRGAAAEIDKWLKQK